MAELAALTAKYTEPQRNAQKLYRRLWQFSRETREGNEELRVNFETLKEACQALEARLHDSELAHRNTQQELARVIQERKAQFLHWKADIEVKP